MNGETKIKKCTCNHEYQDETYGPGNRVCNMTNAGFRCTVCGNRITDTAAKK